MKPYYQDDAVTIYHGDCREIMPSLDGDVLLTDPPYNVGFKYGDSFTDDNPEHVGDFNRLLASARASAAVFFPGCVNLFDVPAMLAGTGFEHRQTLGWHRKEYAGDVYKHGPAMTWEPVIWASRNGRTWNNLVGGPGRDFIIVNRISGERDRTGHPCPKPEPVMRWLVELFVPPGGIALDPFLGSGTTARAAKDLGRKCIGIEIEERYCELAAKRMSQTVMAL